MVFFGFLPKEKYSVTNAVPVHSLRFSQIYYFAMCLFYKIYRGLDIIGGGREVMATTILVQINLMTISISIFGTVSLGAFIFIGIIGLYLASYYTNNEERIIEKYESESERSRKIGNVIVAIYLILTFAIPYILIRNN